MQHKILWSDRPSLFIYAGTYLVSAIVLYVLHWFRLYMGLQPFQWMGNLHIQYIMMDWQQQAHLLMGALVDAMMILIIVSAAFKLLETMVKRYIVMDDQLITRSLTAFGIREERLELYRIVDFEFQESFLGMIFRFGSVMLRTNDQARPRVILTGIRRGHDFLDMLRQETERCRKQKGVREITMPVAPQ
ncbi:MAG: hypothetical protein K0S29_598 [Gammaproteobacteria bacterium]|jgi:hypothetical protein|nr:hypothetical protein [Gammaproteobacteria bacterium]